MTAAKRVDVVAAPPPPDDMSELEKLLGSLPDRDLPRILAMLSERMESMDELGSFDVLCNTVTQISGQLSVVGERLETIRAKMDTSAAQHAAMQTSMDTLRGTVNRIENTINNIDETIDEARKASDSGRLHTFAVTPVSPVVQEVLAEQNDQKSECKGFWIAVLDKIANPKVLASVSALILLTLILALTGFRGISWANGEIRILWAGDGRAAHSRSAGEGHQQ